MEKINIVVLSEDLDLRIQIKNLVQNEEYVISGYSDFTDEAKIKVENMFPDMVVCAVRGEVPDKIFDFIQKMLVNMRDCVMVLANDNISVELVNTAAQFGFRRVLPLDSMSPEDFAAALKTVYTLERQRMVDTNEGKKVRSKVISFFGGKGGTGKTTLSVNIASMLAKTGKKVMLMDLDLQFGDVALALDLDAKYSIVDLVQDRNGITIENINNFAVAHSSGISVLCAPKSPEFADFVTPAHVERIIDTMRPYFEYIIIDMPPTFSETSIVACENSEEIYLVYNPEILSLRNAKVCINILDQLHQKDKIRLIINRYEKGMIRVKDFEDMFQMPVFATIPLDIKSALDSVNKGQPIMISQPRSLAAKAIADAAEDIIAIHTGITPLTVKQRKRKQKINRKQAAQQQRAAKENAKGKNRKGKI